MKKGFSGTNELTQPSSTKCVTTLHPPHPKVIYLIGSLRNSGIPLIANQLRKLGYDVFDDWFAPGPKADDWWQHYETTRGRTYEEALDGYAAKHIFEFDFSHLLWANIAILVMPAGKSGHLELGWLLGRGVPGYILFDRVPERWDVMYQLANGVFFTFEGLRDTLTRNHSPS